MRSGSRNAEVFGGSAHSNIAIEFGFRGVGTTNSNSCASGTVSVGEALRYIRDDFADVIVAGGAEAPLTAITIGAFDIIKTMSRWTGDPALACRPFDLLRDGFVMGEGGASLVVEELEHARARGARIYAEVLGYAQLAPEQIDYVNAHASSTQLNDSTETASIKQVLGEQAQRIAVSGTKGYYAHPLGATGTIEAALCALALDRQWIPPTINYGNPDPACDLDIVPNSGRAAELNYVMSNS
ncbi:MAG: beta-ketoacyl-[acyl-carrier-protein] synthase II, partial [Acidobacteria bacterium]